MFTFARPTNHGTPITASAEEEEADAIHWLRPRCPLCTLALVARPGALANASVFAWTQSSARLDKLGILRNANVVVVAGVSRRSPASTGKRGTLTRVDVNADLKPVRHRNAGTRTNASVHVSLRPVLSDSNGTQPPAVVEVMVDVRPRHVAPSSDGTQSPVGVYPLVF